MKNHTMQILSKMP